MARTCNSHQVGNVHPKFFIGGGEGGGGWAEPEAINNLRFNLKLIL
jgi:hypothetical protein